MESYYIIIKTVNRSLGDLSQQKIQTFVFWERWKYIRFSFTNFKIKVTYRLYAAEIKFKGLENLKNHETYPFSDVK